MKLVLKEDRFRKLSVKEWPRFKAILFPSVDTFIATKAAAARVLKRRRDTFDIFVSLVDAGPTKVGRRWKTLQKRDGMFQEAGDSIHEAVFKGDGIEKACAFLPESAHSRVEEVFQDFLKASGRGIPVR